MESMSFDRSYHRANLRGLFGRLFAPFIAENRITVIRKKKEEEEDKHQHNININIRRKKKEMD